MEGLMIQTPCPVPSWLGAVHLSLSKEGSLKKKDRPDLGRSFGWGVFLVIRLPVIEGH